MVLVFREITKVATLSERLAKKLGKHELNLKFLVTCRYSCVYKKIRRWKNVNKIIQKYVYRKVLLHYISKRRKSVKLTKKDFRTSVDNLLTSTVFSKGILLKISIN